jgi:hypothetical protein
MKGRPESSRPRGDLLTQPPFLVDLSGYSSPAVVIFTSPTSLAVADFGSGGRNAARREATIAPPPAGPTPDGIPKPLTAPV